MNGITLRAVKSSDRELLWNIFQKYMYEMSYLYLDEMDADGNYPYEHFNDYFTDERRAAYFICHDDTVIGFAMLCPYSCMDMERDYTMAEFTVFPTYRHKHYASEAVKMILAEHPGRWEIKYSENNPAARKLWNDASAPYSPQAYDIGGDETALIFTVREG